MKWTKDKPTKPGYYWAVFKLINKFPYPIILQYTEYDVGGVVGPILRKKEYYTMFDEKPTDINLFSHFMGPFPLPEGSEKDIEYSFARFDINRTVMI